MSALTILSGAPGTGKTTVAAHLAKAAPRGVHIPSDVFYTFPATPIPPHLPAAHHQNTAIVSAMVRAAAFAIAGYDVFLDGILGPWFMKQIGGEIAGVAHVHYVVLCAPLELCVQRVRARADGSDEAVVRKMHAELADLGPYVRHGVDTANRSAADVAAEIARRIQQGDLVLRLG